MQNDEENHNPEGQEDYYDESQYYEEQPQPQVVVPKKKGKANMPLIEVLVGSLILHLVAGILLGGLVIYQMSAPPEPEFEPPPEIEVVEPQKLEYKVKMKQQQKNSAKPRQQRIQVQTITDIPVPNIDIDVPAVDSKVAVGTGTGGGTGTGMGDGGGLGLGQTAVNFFGIKSGGEKVYFVVDASKFMLTDSKGGYPAYSLIKSEIARLTGKMPPGALFNAVMYSGANVYKFSPQLAAATANTEKDVKKWIDPINVSASSAGQISSNYTPEKTDFTPMGPEARNWIKGMQSAMEDGADTIFLLVSEWNWHGRDIEGEALKDWLKNEKGWDDKDEEKWLEDMKEAEAWLAEENKNRRASGKPERVVVWIGDIVQELGGKVKPAPNYTVQEIIMQLENMIDYYYTDKGKQKPSIYVVLYVGQGELESLEQQTNRNFEQFKQVTRVGRGGRIKILEGMAELKNVTQRAAEEDAAK